MPEKKIHKFKEHSFTLKDDVLEVMNACNPFLLEYRRNIKLFTDDIERKEWDKAVKEINEKRTAYLQRLELIKTQKEKKERTENEGHIKRLKEEIEELKTEFKANQIIQKQITEYNESIGLATHATITDKTVIVPFLKNVLDRDVSVLDYKSPEIYGFVIGVVNDFFLFIRKVNPALFSLGNAIP